MANLTYAVVPTSTLPYDQATAVKHLLTNLVTYSHGGVAAGRLRAAARRHLQGGHVRHLQ